MIQTLETLVLVAPSSSHRSIRTPKQPGRASRPFGAFADFADPAGDFPLVWVPRNLSAISAGGTKHIPDAGAKNSRVRKLHIADV